MSIGLAISFTVINIYETRAHPLDHRYELGLEETAEDRARSELKHKNKQIDKERKLEYKKGDLNVRQPMIPLGTFFLKNRLTQSITKYVSSVILFSRKLS